MAYTAQQIAIIRSKTARRTAVTAPAAEPAKRDAKTAPRTQRRWKAGTPKPAVPFVSRPPEHFDFEHPVTIMFVSEQTYDAPVAHVVSNSRQAFELFGLTHLDGLKSDLNQFTVDGVVYATIDPYEDDLYDRRYLLFGANAADLRKRYNESHDSI